MGNHVGIGVCCHDRKINVFFFFFKNEHQLVSKKGSYLMCELVVLDCGFVGSAVGC